MVSQSRQGSRKEISARQNLKASNSVMNHMKTSFFKKKIYMNKKAFRMSCLLFLVFLQVMHLFILKLSCKQLSLFIKY